VGVRETERERERERERAEMKKMAQQKEINNKEQEKSYRITLGIASFVKVQLILFWTFVVWYPVLCQQQKAHKIYIMKKNYHEPMNDGAQQRTSCSLNSKQNQICCLRSGAPAACKTSFSTTLTQSKSE